MPEAQQREARVGLVDLVHGHAAHLRPVGLAVRVAGAGRGALPLMHGRVQRAPGAAVGGLDRLDDLLRRPVESLGEVGDGGGAAELGPQRLARLLDRQAQLLDVARRAHVPRRIAEVAPELAEGRHEAAFDRIAEGLALLDPASDADEHARLLHVRGISYGALNQHLAAAETLEQARDVMERHEVNDPRLRARILVALGTAYRRLNRTAKAMQTFTSALDLASGALELRLAALGYVGVAVSLYDAGELDASLTNYRRALDLFARVSDRSFELSVLHSLASIQLERGATGEAHELAERCVALAQGSGEAATAATAEIVLARIALRDGDAAKALGIAKHAEKTLSEDRVQRADALRVIGAAQDALGAYTASDRAYRKGLELLTEIGDQPDRAALADEYAHKLRARGEVEQAFHYLELARSR